MAAVFSYEMGGCLLCVINLLKSRSSDSTAASEPPCLGSGDKIASSSLGKAAFLGAKSGRWRAGGMVFGKGGR